MFFLINILLRDLFSYKLKPNKMKPKFKMILTLFTVLIVQLTFAQQKTVSGIVSDENGLPLIGATVVI